VKQEERMEERKEWEEVSADKDDMHRERRAHLQKRMKSKEEEESENKMKGSGSWWEDESRCL
jgi:hypothetical protein